MRGEERDEARARLASRKTCGSCRRRRSSASRPPATCAAGGVSGITGEGPQEARWDLRFLGEGAKRRSHRAGLRTRSRVSSETSVSDAMIVERAPAYLQRWGLGSGSGRSSIRRRMVRSRSPHGRRIGSEDARRARVKGVGSEGERTQERTCAPTPAAAQGPAERADGRCPESSQLGKSSATCPGGHPRP